MEELEMAMKEARSFTGLKPPNNAKLFGKMKAAEDVVNIYEDSQGNYWYDTERGRKFEQEMQERAKKRKKRRNRKVNKP